MEIRVFDGNVTAFDTGGVVISPLKVSVREEANAIYQLSMTVARDDHYGRHKLLKPMNIIYASVPSKNMPIKRVETTTGMVNRWQVHGKYQLVYTLAVTKEFFDREVEHYQHSTVPEPSYAEAYAYCFDKYAVQQKEYSGVPLYKTVACKEAFANLDHNSPVNCLQEYADCIFAVAPTGQAGYILKTDATYIGSFEGDVWSIVDAGITTGGSQPFRIVSVTSRDGRYIDVIATHVYFDAQAHERMYHEIVNQSLESLCEDMNENGIITYHAGADVYVNGDFSSSNTVQLVSVLCDEYDLQLVRDGWDAYLLPSGNTERAYTLETGKNITQYSLTEDISNLKTRFVPYVEEEEHPDDAVDSSHIDDYIRVYTGLIQGETVEDAQEQARKRFAKGVDLPEVSIDISAIHGAIDTASIFDDVRVLDRALELDYTAKINSIEYDPINERITSLSLGATQGRLTRVFTVPNGTWQNTTKG